MSRRYKQGQNRNQDMLLPPSVEEYVSEDNTVRAIDAYVESLDLQKLGYTNTQGGISQGQPAYAPAALLKLYLYGYLMRIRSSRRLEQECYRNLEVMWLMAGLRPTFKTIANFRSTNAKALRETNRAFILLCRELELYGKELVAIDGSFFRGNASSKSIFTEKRLKGLLERLEVDINRYLNALDEADKVEDKQLSEVDPHVRRLKKHGQNVSGYNVQIAVDSKHALLAECDVTNDGNDLNQLAPMAVKAKEALKVETLTVVADTGYHNGAQLKECEDAAIIAYVPERAQKGSSATAERVPRSSFVYDAERNAYQCPQGRWLTYLGPTEREGTTYSRYASKKADCAGCSLRETCLSAKGRRREIYRSEYEESVIRARERMQASGAAALYKQRGCLAEHPFGTLKRRCGMDHFLVRTLPKVNGEMNLMMLCYNFKRVLNLLGMELFKKSLAGSLA
jgi:transposase